ICSAHAMVLRAKPGTILPDLLPFFLQSDMFMERAIEISVGSLSPTINWNTLRVQEFLLPPIEEQKRIAEILWTADEVVEGYAKLKRDLWRYRTTLFEDLLPDPQSSEHHGETVRLDQVCHMDEGRVFPSKDYRAEGIRLIRPGNLHVDGTFLWTSDNTKYLPVSYLDKVSKLLVQPGEIVMNLTAQSLEDAFIGRVCLATGEDTGLLNQRLGRFVCHDEVISEYLFRNMQTSRFRRLVETRCEGSKIRHIYFRHIADFPLILIPRKEQVAVAERCAHIDEAYQRALEMFGQARKIQKILTNKLAANGIEQDHV
ncbi:MAG: restriction endonuclease subunit S, partial [Actinomycetota bacterium]|nr:restriction endonuclease subunit S [Actinomycetota bacterium]